MSTDTHGSDATEPGTVDIAKPAADASDSAAADTRAAAEESTSSTTTEPANSAGSGAQAADAADAGAEKSTDTGESDDEPAERRSPALIATAVALPIALVAGVLVMGVLANRHPAREPLVLGAVQAPAAAGPLCSALLPALPEKLGDYSNSELVQPAPVGAKAWQLSDGGDAIVLRCGLDRPLEFNRASPLQVVNGVNWFDVRDQTSGAASGTYWAVDRGTYIALTMPDNAGPTPLQEISDAVSKAMPQQALDPGPLPN
ncbi:DUF3515 domain-containing protein [Nocardia sp. NPDC056000]|uniref:DUF3515 domain-containing protein n=1 Tax=Nocardia sp. NPDC056000 TaxID=3345674 RepID=UPI0035D683A8